MASRDPFAANPDALLDELARGGPAVGQEDVLRAAQSGDELERFLLEQGFFGEIENIPVDPIVTMRALGTILSEMREDAIEERWPQDSNTLLNFAFKNGHHFIEADRSKRAVVPLPAPKGLVRRKVAKFEPWFRAQHGRLAGGQPQSQIVPKTNQIEDKDAADYAEELIEWLTPFAWSHENKSEVAMWGLLGGLAIVHPGITWVLDPEYEQATGFPHRPDLEFIVLSPMECWTDNDTPQIKNKTWFGRDIILTEADAKAKFQLVEDQEKLTLETDRDPHSERGYHTLKQVRRFLYREDPWSTPSTPNVPARHHGQEDVIVAEFWGDPGLVLQGRFLEGLGEFPELTTEVLHDGSDGRPALVRFPEGLRVQFTPEGHVLDIVNNFYGFLPFREFKFSQSAGFWSPAWATPLRELNQAIDWAYSLREQHLMRTAIPPFLEPKEAKINRRFTSSGISQRIKYSANRFGAKPEWANPPNMPVDTIQFIQELERLFQDIGALHEVSQGRLPAQLSGVAVSLLQEQDLQQLGFPGEELESGYRDIMRMGMLNIQQFWPENDPRLIQLAGNALYKLSSFMQSDLNSSLDIQIQKGSAIPRSAAAIKAETRELWELGALIDEFGRPDFKRLLSVYEHGSEDALYEEEELDEANAREEEDAILQLDPLLAEQVLVQALEVGQLPPPLGLSSFDNHLIHERSHRKRLKRIENDPRIAPANQALLEFHWTLTVQAALPILIQTDPDVALPFLGPEAAQEDEGGGESTQETNS